MGKVKTQPLRRDELARLMNVVSKRFPQRCLEQMGGSMVSHNRPAVVTVDIGLRDLPNGNRALFNHAVMDKMPTVVLLTVCNTEQALFGPNGADVGNLPAAFCIERSFVQNHRALAPGVYLPGNLPFSRKGKDLRLTGKDIVTDNLSRREG